MVQTLVVCCSVFPSCVKSIPCPTPSKSLDFDRPIHESIYKAFRSNHSVLANLKCYYGLSQIVYLCITLYTCYIHAVVYLGMSSSFKLPLYMIYINTHHLHSLTVSTKRFPLSKHLRAFPWQLPGPPPEPSFHKMHHLPEFQVCSYETFASKCSEYQKMR